MMERVELSLMIDGRQVIPAEKKSASVARKKTTTIRCSQDVANTINALVAVEGMGSVDELLDHLTRGHIMALSDDERREYDYMLRAYNKRTGKPD